MWCSGFHFVNFIYQNIGTTILHAQQIFFTAVSKNFTIHNPAYFG